MPETDIINSECPYFSPEVVYEQTFNNIPIKPVNSFTIEVVASIIAGLIIMYVFIKKGKK